MSHKGRTEEKLVMKNSSLSISEVTIHHEDSSTEKPFPYIMLRDNFTRNLIILYKHEVEEVMNVFATWLDSYIVQDVDVKVNFQPATDGNTLGYLTKENENVK